MTMTTNYVPKNGEDVFVITVDGQDHEVAILETFGNGYVVIEALTGEPFVRGSIWGAFMSCQTMVPRTLLKYAYTQRLDQ